MDMNQFREMSTKKKLRWLFDYYGLTFIVIIVCVFVACMLIKSVFRPEQIEDIIVLIYSDQVVQEQCADFEKEIERATGKSASVQVYNVSDPYGAQAFAAKVGCDVIDLVIASKKEMEVMSESGYLLSYGMIDNSAMYMGIPRSSRRGEALEETINYFNGVLGN